MFLRFKAFGLLAILILASVSFLSAQETNNRTPNVRPKSDADSSPTPTPTPAQSKQDARQNITAEKGRETKSGEPTAEQVAESAIFIYGGGLGRANLDQIRKTTFEKGKMSLTDASGKTEQANYERWILRGESLEKEKVRFDKEFPGAKFALVTNSEKVFGLLDNDAVFTPREDAIKEFQNRIWHGLEALLRYKENGSTVEMVKRDKIMGVDFYVLDVNDKQNRKTRFYVSVKTFRVMILEYTEDSIKYKRKFYDYNYAQGTLVPYRTVLWANDKKIEEMDVQTITFGQKVEEDLFAGN